MTKKFQTIRETAKSSAVSENFLRVLVAQGKCPGIYAGNRFMVNVPLLMETLEAESLRAVKSN